LRCQACGHLCLKSFVIARTRSSSCAIFMAM
jgi:hypothetical protein